MTAVSPISRCAGAVHGGEGDHLELLDHAVRRPRAAGRGRRGGRSSRGGDRLAAVVVAHGADEQVHSPGGRVRDGGQHLGRVQGRLAEVEQPYDGGVRFGAHPPESTAPGSPPADARLAAPVTLESMSNDPGGPDDNPFKGTPFEQIFDALGGAGCPAGRPAGRHARPLRPDGPDAGHDAAVRRAGELDRSPPTSPPHLRAGARPEPRPQRPDRGRRRDAPGRPLARRRDRAAPPG